MSMLIENETHYSKALARIYELMQTDVNENTSESDELEVLSVLVNKYEIEHYPVRTALTR